MFFAQLHLFSSTLHTIENETTVFNLVFKGFLQTYIPQLFSLFYAKEEDHDFPLKIFCLTVPKKIVGEAFCVSENFWCRKTLWIKGGRVSRFLVEITLSHSTQTFRRGAFL